MKELNVSEIEQVNGGLGPLGGFFVAYVAGKLLDAAIAADWGQAGDTTLAP